MPIRATRDPEVIAAWAKAVTAYQQECRRVRPVLLFAIVVCFGLAITLQNGYLLWLVLALVLALMAVEFWKRAPLICPHCSRSPVPFNHGSPGNVEFCPHCFYWLKPPWP